MSNSGRPLLDDRSPGSDGRSPGPGGQPTGASAGKIAVRTRLLAARRALTESARWAAAQRVQRAAVALLAGRSQPAPAAPLPEPGAAGPPLTVAAYAPVGSEPGGPDLPAVLARALPAGSRLLLPVLLPDLALDWAEYGGTLVPGPRGLSTPPGPRLGPAAIGAAALVLVPALAVDRAGTRLGRGGGSYDRALALTAADALVVALLHDGELCAEALPAEPHDRPVHAVITPGRGLVRLPADPSG